MTAIIACTSPHSTVKFTLFGSDMLTLAGVQSSPDRTGADTLIPGISGRIRNTTIVMRQSHVFFNWRNLDRNEYRRGNLSLLLGFFLPAPMLLNPLPDEVRIDPILIRNSCHQAPG